jgi:hypothetical protein
VGQVPRKASTTDYDTAWGDVLTASGSVTADFGASAAIVTASVSLPTVTASSKIIAAPRYSSSVPDHDPEDYAIEGIQAVIGQVTAGVGFDIIASCPNGTWGRYNIDYQVI